MKHFIKLFVLIAIISIAGISRAEQVGNSDHLIDDMRLVKIDSSDFDDEYENAMNNDGIEGVNRAIFGFNKTIDDYFLAPVARGYRYLVHDWIRARISNFFNNLDEPRNAANALLQGDVEGIFRGFWRFVINTTIGIGGAHDVAGGFGLKERDKDFSQTLAFYGIGSGSYFVIPFLGPSTIRDFGGSMADGFANPTYFVNSMEGSLALVAGNVVSQRERLLDITDDIEDEAFDLYSAYKSSYLQNRKRNLINNL